jgi:membrane dipeptidase
LNRWITLAFVCVLIGAASLFTFASGDNISDQARTLHFHSIVIDTHDDTTQRLLDPGFDIGVRHADGDIDIPRMREGGLGGIFFSIWIPGTIAGPEAVIRALRQIDAVREMTRLHASDLGVLRDYAALGVRYMTLTHSVNVDWADSSTDKPAHNGLTDFGKSVVREMNRLGMMVDISHVSDKTFYDALAVSQAPLIASHSSCRALCNAPRDMTDDMIEALAAKGGVIQINYHIGFLSQQYRDATIANPALMKSMDDQVKKRCGEDEACQLIEGEKLTRQLVEQGKLPRVGWDEIIEHIDHAVKLVGADHVGLGSDFDGANMPYGMDDVSQLPKITDALLKKGYSQSDVEKILGGNTLRVMEQVEAVAKQMGGKS